MSSKIHHNTAKKAKKFGVELVAVENEFEASKDGKTLACHASASVALEKAIAALTLIADAKPGSKVSARKARAAAKRVISDEDGDEAEDLEEGELDEPEEPEEGHSVVKHQYKTAYKARPLKISCSDDLAVQIANHIKTKDEDSKLRVDGAKLKSFARANSCWDPKYANLNLGMQRMNVVNRLRAKIRRDKHVVVWG